MLRAGIFVFQGTSPLGRGEIKSKESGKKSTHYNGSEENVELILRTIISVNQFSIYGAVADLCKELEPDYAESEICDSLVIPSQSSQSRNTFPVNKQGFQVRDLC